MIPITPVNDGVLLPVKVVPRASSDRIVGELDGALKVAVTAPPERGAANKAVCRFLARKLGIRTQQVIIEAGHTSPRKMVRIRGLKPQDIRKALPGS